MYKIRCLQLITDYNTVLTPYKNMNDRVFDSVKASSTIDYYSRRY